MYICSSKRKVAEAYGNIIDIIGKGWLALDGSLITSSLFVSS